MFLTPLVFLLTLSVLVLVHELGHFLLAKKAGIRVEEFGFGYPPKIFSKKVKGTIYSVNLIPFGGFVRLYGEELDEAGKPLEGRGAGAFWAQSKKARFGVIVSGVLANFVLAIFCFSALYSVFGVPVRTKKVEVIEILKDSPAQISGIKSGDIVLEVNGQKMENVDSFTTLIQEQKGKKIRVLVEREKNNSDNLLFFLEPRRSPPEGEGPLGVVVSDIVIKKYPFWQMPIRGAVEGIKEAVNWTELILKGLGQMVVNLVARGELPRDISGPLGIYQITGQVAQGGFWPIVKLIGILSINLAIMNILPLPALDGGRLTFLVYEVITRRRPKASFERWTNAVGMAFLLLLLCLITANDLTRMVDFGNLIGTIRGKLGL